MQALLDRVRRTIRDHRLAEAGTRVVAAVSGGSDSVALVHLLAALAGARELRLSALAHFNHQLRPTAGRDEAFCRDLADALDLPIEIGVGDIASKARTEHRSIEDAARTARHEFFERARRAHRADAVAVGHTRDDQAETILLRLIAGAGARGLASMHPRSGTIIRPLLDCRRRELAEWLEARGLAWMTDESNADVGIPRNRVRAELVPLLENRFNPAVVDVLADAAAIARDEWAWMAAAADAARAELETSENGIVSFDAPRLAAVPAALRRLVIWRALTERGARVTFAHVQAVLELLDPGHAPGPIDLPGHSVERAGRRLVLRNRAGAVRRRASANLFEYPLSIPGEVLVAEAGCVVSVEQAEQATSADTDGEGAVVRRELCGSHLIIRNRRPGDRFRAAGRRGRKLQDLFVDSRIERGRRDRIPLITSESGRILWVAGYGVAEEFRVTDPSQAVLILRLRHV